MSFGRAPGSEYGVPIPNKSKRAKYATVAESRAAVAAGLRRAAAMRASMARDRYYRQDFAGSPGVANYTKWAGHVLDPAHGYEYYLDHRLPSHGIPEPGRGGVWGPKTRPHAFVEKYDPRTHTVFLVPKTRGPAKVTGLMYSGARYGGQLTKHYKKVVFTKAAEHAARTGKGKVPGGSIDEKYKWARGYLQRNKLGIPRKNRENMGQG